MDNKDDLDMCSKDKGLRCAPGVFAAMIGVAVKTLQRWDRNGKLPAGHYPSGRRFYTAEHYAACGGDPGLFAGKAQEGAGAMHKDFVSKFFRGLRPVGNILLAMLIPAVQFVLLESFL